MAGSQHAQNNKIIFQSSCSTVLVLRGLYNMGTMTDELQSNAQHEQEQEQEQQEQELGVTVHRKNSDSRTQKVQFSAGSILAIEIESKSWAEITVSEGVSLSLSMASASFDAPPMMSSPCTTTTGSSSEPESLPRRGVEQDTSTCANNNMTSELKYATLHPCPAVTLARLVPGHPTVSGLGLLWEGPQRFILHAVCSRGSVTVCGSVSRHNQQQQQQQQQQHHAVEAAAAAAARTNSTRPLPQPLPVERYSNDTSARTTPSTMKTTKRKLDAQAIIDELDEMQADGVPINDNVNVQTALASTNLSNGNKRNKVDVESSSSSTSTTTTMGQVALDPPLQVPQQDDEPQPILSRKQRKKLATQKAKELEKALAVAARRDCGPRVTKGTTTCATSGSTTTTTTRRLKSTTTLPDSLLKERRLKNGLILKDIRLGDGPLVQPGRKVSIRYTASFPDGTVFDQNQSNDDDDDDASSLPPLQFRHGTGQVVRGLDEGMVGMRVGGERVLVVPPDLGYGTRGSGTRIPPNATLCFVVSLVS